MAYNRDEAGNVGDGGLIYPGYAAPADGGAEQKRITFSGGLETDRFHSSLILDYFDIGGLLGLHFKEEMRLQLPIISIDGIDLREFDYIDIGELIPTSGAVPVVIKSLVFPSATQRVGG